MQKQPLGAGKSAGEKAKKSKAKKSLDKMRFTCNN